MKYTVIIADDEPLALVGLQSLINWESENLEIIYQARNGKMLYDAIVSYQPDIVITDIKMPLMDGLQVMEKIYANMEHRPYFILMTNFEEFDLVKKAIRLDAIDYLVKIEQDSELFLKALRRAKEKIEEKRLLQNSEKPRKDARTHGTEILQDKFFIRQFFNLSNHACPIESQIANLGIDLDYNYFAVSYVSIPSILSMENAEKAISLYYSTLHLFKETISRYVWGYVTSLDLGHFAITFCFDESRKANYKNFLYTTIHASRESAKNFFSLDTLVSVGPPVDNIGLLYESFYKASTLVERTTENNPIVFYEDRQNINFIGKTLGQEKYRMRLKRAFEEMDLDEMDGVLSDIAKKMNDENMSLVNALDAASNILYMAMSLLPDGQNMIEEIFASNPLGTNYRILYHARNSHECAMWLLTLKDGIKEKILEKRQDYRKITITKIQNYIKENVTRRLTLGEVSGLFGYSEGYLSILFSKYANMSFVNYVTKEKIHKAKEMLSSENAKVYEVAEALGFESPFYFSKVFKKVAGISPSEYIQNRQE